MLVVKIKQKPCLNKDHTDMSQNPTQQPQSASKREPSDIYVALDLCDVT